MTAVAERRPAIWRLPPDHLQRDLLPGRPLLSAVLASRGIASVDDAERFLAPGRQPLADPYLLPDMALAVERIRAAATAGERVGVFGDYDVDGLTSTAMLVRVLRRLGAEPIPIVPNRLTQVYGLNEDAIERFASAGCRLMIAVDCGSSNHRELAFALSLGLSAVVLDHHHLGERLPGDVAFVSPRRESNRYPCANLAAVGVVYTVVRALLGDDAAAEMYLPYVALGTVADVVPLTGENRTLVARGITKLRRWKLPGMIALCASAGIDQSRLRTRDLGHAIAPRINAAGRMASPLIALDLLLADDSVTAAPLAVRLSRLNEQRQAETARIVAEAEAMLRLDGGIDRHPAIVVADPSWSVGLVGIVAGRLAESYYRPAFVIERGDDVSRGSGRSVGSLDLVTALRATADLLQRYGGHQHAAGLTLASRDIDTFRVRLSAAVLDLCGGELPVREIAIDAEAQHTDLTLSAAHDLEAMEPCGEGNESPLLLVRRVRTRYARTSSNGRHLLFDAVDHTNRATKAVFFGAGDRLAELRSGALVDLVGALACDTWDGRERLKLLVTDFRPAG